VRKSDSGMRKDLPRHAGSGAGPFCGMPQHLNLLPSDF